MFKILSLLIVLALSAFLLACSGSEDEPTLTSTPVSTPIPTPTQTPGPTPAPTQARNANEPTPEPTSEPTHIDGNAGIHSNANTCPDACAHPGAGA